jgi:hypothetical protein
MNTHAKNLREIFPAGIAVVEFGPELTITRRWSIGFPWREIVACAGWLCVFLWYAMIFLMYRSGESRAMVLFLAIWTIPHAIGIVCWTYYAICCHFNRTVITITKASLVIRHGPLPLLWYERYNPQDFQQLFCREVKEQRRGPPRITYELLAWNRDDSFDLLLTGFDDLSQAHYLEARIERYLGLAKERVPPGYIPRPQLANSVA